MAKDASKRQAPYKDNPEEGDREQASLDNAKRRRDELKEKLLDGMKEFDLESFRKSEDELKALKRKNVRKFYTEQNAKLNDWLEVDSLVKHLSDDVLDSMNPDPDFDGDIDIEAPLLSHGGEVNSFLPPEEQKRRASNKKKAAIALNVNVGANVLLLIAKIVAVFSSGSLSLIASTTDSALDLLCTMIIYSTSKLVSMKMKSLKANFPVGRRKLEPLGVLVFSIIMVVSFVQIFKESFTKLLPSGDHKVVELKTLAIVAMAGNAAVKGIIGLCCSPIKTSQIQALVQDCYTDVIFNTASLLFPLIGHKFNIWWLDPAGAAILSVYIVGDWASTALENVSRLTGCATDARTQQKLTYLAWRFAPLVDAYKSLTCYHAGDGVWVEFDVLLGENTPLHKAHDVSETLQMCAEGLSEVDRAFVSVDYSVRGPRGHAQDMG